MKKLLQVLFLGLVFSTIASAQIVVRLTDGNQANVITPNAIAVVTGRDWLEGAAGDHITKHEQLAGYSVKLAGAAAALVYVSAAGIVFQVPAVEAGPRTLAIEGPAGLITIFVQVEPFWPLLVLQDGNVVALTFTTTPRIYIGKPIPLEPFTTVAFWARGLVTGQAERHRTLVSLERGSEQHTVGAEVFADPIFPGLEKLIFRVPPCLQGEYQAIAIVAGFVSNAGLVRFSSDCAAVTRVGRPAR